MDATSPGAPPPNPILHALAGAEDVLHVLDLPGALKRLYYILPPETSPGGEPTAVTRAATLLIEEILEGYKPGYFAIADDADRNQSWRRDRLPGYKPFRMVYPNDLEVQRIRVHQIAEAMGIPVFKAFKFDAVDVLATLAAWGKDIGLRVLLHSNHRLPLALVDDQHVFYWHLNKKAPMSTSDIEKRWDAKPSDLPALFALAKQEGLPGVKGVGPAKAAVLLAKYGSVEKVIENMEAIDHPLWQERFRNGETALRLAVELARLRDDAPIDFDIRNCRVGGADGARVEHLADRLGLTMKGLVPPSTKPPLPSGVLYRHLRRQIPWHLRRLWPEGTPLTFELLEGLAADTRSYVASELASIPFGRGVDLATLERELVGDMTAALRARTRGTQ